MPSDLVRVSPQEMIRRNPGESDADVRRRWAAEQKAIQKKMAEAAEARRFYAKREKANGLSEQIGYDILRAMGKKFAKGGVMEKAAGGAAKVRKGMASPEGKIIEAMNRIRGK